LGKGGVTWEHAQVVELSSLGIMGAPERLDHPINTCMESHDYQNKEEHVANTAHQNNRRVGRKYAIIDGKTGSFGHTWSAVEHNGLVECEKPTNQQRERNTIYIPMKPIHKIKELCYKNGDTFIWKKCIISLY
jgi:hypothetical protein